jgi:hypothetical protein
MRPSDFVDLLRATRLPAMWTASINGTAEEAAAAVAFFNGRSDDERPIGVDRQGRDWLTVGHWARLRAEHGHPESAPIHLWEVGNEVFGAVETAGPDCATWGWEDVWTCDGTEYATGNRERDGYLRFREVMQAVDPSIEVGVVGVGDQAAWSSWDEKVMRTVGDEMDFFVLHHYGSNGDVDAEEVLTIPERDWPRITEDVRDGYRVHGIETKPIAVTEHNLVAFLDGDDERLMTSAVNAFYLAETIGQHARNGVAIANQWNLANGRAENGSDYGLIDAKTHYRSPANFAMVLWSRMGAEILAVDDWSSDELWLFATRARDGSIQLLILNPSAREVDSTITLAPAGSVGRVTVDAVVAESLTSTTVSYNGSTEPSIDLGEPPATLAPGEGGRVRQRVPAYSMMLMTWEPQL